MSEHSDTKPTSGKKPLSLSKKIDLSAVKKAAAGRSSVVVEVKKSRSVGHDFSGASVKDSQMRVSRPLQSEKKIKQQVEKKELPKKPTSVVEQRLTHEERNARLKALKEGAFFIEKKKVLLGESAHKHAEIRAEREKQMEEADHLAQVAQEEAEKSAQVQEESFDKKEKEPVREKEDQEEKKEGPAKRFAAHAKRLEPRRVGKITISDALSQEELESNFQRKARSLASLKRAREKEKLKALRKDQAFEKISRDVTIPETISVQELANRMAEKSADVVKCCMKMGMMVTATHTLDADTAQLVAEEMGHKVMRVAESDIEVSLYEDTMETEADFVSRAPVVTIMGHVDHGKTSLLDALRTTDVVSTEAGGITQHIGAYQVSLASGEKITFIDTPGHAAFTEMRSRGARVTDIVVLVVAADDGLKDQTIEAIRHAKAAGVPIIVAINKMDKPDANPDRVRQTLMQHEVFVEALGGDVLCVEVSAKNKTNLDKLTDAILLQAEMMGLKANPSRLATGVVIESKLEKGRGPLATTLVQIGTLKVGDYFVAGAQFGKVRALINERGQTQNEAGPSMPVEVLGFNGLPQAGDAFVVTKDESKAREVAEYRQRQMRAKQMAIESPKRENLFAQGSDKKELSVVIKADVHGSAEAIKSSLQNLVHDEVGVKVLHMGVGAITETDISLAKASGALVLGFNVRPNTQARAAAAQDGVQIRYYSIIYDVINDVKALLSGLLSPVVQEVFIGRAEIRKVFKITGIGHVAGCYVTEGVVKRGAKVRLLRQDVVIHEGKLKTLKRIKEEVKEVRSGFECGMAFLNYEDLREGDIIECSEVESSERSFE